MHADLSNFKFSIHFFFQNSTRVISRQLNDILVNRQTYPIMLLKLIILFQLRLSRQLSYF